MSKLIPADRRELAVQPNGERQAATMLRMPLGDEQLDADLGRLMSEAQAMKPNVELPPGTPDLYMMAWEDLILKYGMDLFVKGLWASLCSGPFFPAPNEIEDAIGAILSKDREARRKAREAKAAEDWEKHKRACRAERDAMTEEERAAEQAQVDRLNQRFRAAVTSRPMPGQGVGIPRKEKPAEDLVPGK